MIKRLTDLLPSDNEIKEEQKQQASNILTSTLDLNVEEELKEEILLPKS